MPRTVTTDFVQVPTRDPRTGGTLTAEWSCQDPECACHRPPSVRDWRPSRETVLVLIATVLAVVFLCSIPGCAWELQAQSDPEAAARAGKSLAAIGEALGGPVGIVCGLLGTGITAVAGVGKITHSLGKQTGRHIGYDEAKGATPGPGQPGSVPVATPPAGGGA